MIHDYRAREMLKVISVGDYKAFESIKSELKDKPYQVKLTMCDADWHVEVVERMIKFAKSRICVVQLVMLYKNITKLLNIDMVHRVIILINSLHYKGRLHSVLSHREIVPREKFRYPKICIG